MPISPGKNITNFLFTTLWAIVYLYGLSCLLPNVWAQTSRGNDYREVFTNQSWNVDCRDDPMEDFRVCWVEPRKLEDETYGANCTMPDWCFNVQVRSDRDVDFISIGQDHYPGKRVGVRVDTREPFWLSPDRQTRTETTPVVNALKAGKKALIQWVKWPYDDVQRASFSLVGFTAAYEEARSAARAYPGPPK